MIRRLAPLLLLLIIIAGLLTPAAAQERVSVATTRDITNGALFLAAARGYFKAEGLALSMRAYPDATAAVTALGEGATDLALAGFGARAFALAGSGKIKLIAARVREHTGYEGNQIVASNTAAIRGLHRLEDLANKSVAIAGLGGTFQYEVDMIARRKGFGSNGVALKPLPSLQAVAQAVAAGKVDAAILPPLYARELLMAGEARPVGWYSEIDGQQLGALFASAATLKHRRAMVEKFLTAYRRGSAAYAAALMRHDSYGKRVFDAKARAVAAAIGLYLYPGYPTSRTEPVVLGAAYFMDARARLDLADLARQVAWYKAQGLIGKNADARAMVDSKSVAAH